MNWRKRARPATERLWRFQATRRRARRTRAVLIAPPLPRASRGQLRRAFAARWVRDGGSRGRVARRSRSCATDDGKACRSPAATSARWDDNPATGLGLEPNTRRKRRSASTFSVPRRESAMVHINRITLNIHVFFVAGPHHVSPELMSLVRLRSTCDLFTSRKLSHFKWSSVMLSSQ